MLSAVFSALHLLALAIGLPGVFLRGRALKGPLDETGLRRLFAADTVWGVAAGLWIVTGLLRAFGGLEKGRPVLPLVTHVRTQDGAPRAGAAARGLAHGDVQPVAHRAIARPEPPQGANWHVVRRQPAPAGHCGRDGVRGQPDGPWRRSGLAQACGPRPRVTMTLPCPNDRYGGRTKGRSHVS